MVGLWLLALLACVSAQSEFNKNRCWTSGNGQGVRYWDEGSQITRGRYWYECRRTKLEPRGCLDPSGRKVSIGGTFERNDYEMTCQMGNDGYLSFKMTACLPRSGGRYTAGQQWNEPGNGYWFVCEKRPYSLRIKTGGCVTRSFERIKIGSRRVVDEYWYECQHKWNGSVSLCAIGCVHNGHKYRIGESWPDGDYEWYCKEEDGKTAKICVGCRYRDQVLNDGDKYFKGDIVYQCTISPDDHSHRAVGCVATDTKTGVRIERVIGCRWVEADYQGRFEMGCEPEGENACKKVDVGCIWQHRGVDYLSVPPNSYTIWFDGRDNKAVGCKLENGHMSLVEFQAADMAHRAAGLLYTPPRARGKKK